MDIKKLAPWINRYFHRQVGGDHRPTFFEIDTVCPRLNDLTKSYLDIKDEYKRMRQLKERMPCYHDIDPSQAGISANDDKNWNVYMLQLAGHQNLEARDYFPQTLALINAVPDLFQAFFSIMQGGHAVPLHQGPYMGYLRYHLGLEVPTKNPPKLILNGQDYCWQEGEGVLFDDTWPHQVINHAVNERVVLIVDILRPMPAFAHLVNQLITRYITKATYAKQVMKRVDNY